MIIEVKRFPESQEVMDNPEWFFICDAGEEIGILGDSAYGRVLEDYKKVSRVYDIEGNVVEVVL